MQERYGRLLQAMARRRGELRELIAERRAALERHGPNIDAVEDAVDTAFHRSSAEVENGMIEHYLREVAQIEAAEARAAAGIFGICAGCMLPIDESRLAANPTALRCVACQELHEKPPVGGMPRAAQS
jgi:RNA polymerase-binding transcription factor